MSGEAEAQQFTRPTNKTAILVIHGIGQQNPYETLDSFARGLVDYFRKTWKLEPKLEPCRIRHKDWTEVAINLEFTDTPASYSGPSRVSLYEFYWAPYTQDKISYLASLKWLIRTSITPLQQISANLQELLAAGTKMTRPRILLIFLRELLRTLLLYLPLLGVLLALFFVIAKPISWSSLEEVFAGMLPSSFSWLTVAFILCAATSAALLLSLAGFLRDLVRRRGHTIQAKADAVWFVLAATFAALFGLAAWFLAGESEAIRAAIAGLIAARATALKLAVVAGLIWLVRRVLVDYVGDVAIYVSSDAKSKGFEARSKILKGATESLTAILMDSEKDFDQVILAGHSLGSVVAYDTINRLFGQAWAAEDKSGDQPRVPSEKQLNKLKGLVTFGSPLDKIYYFFRQQVNQDQAVRAQIISFLHPFRRVRSGRDYGDYLFTYRQKRALDNSDQPYAFPDFSRFRWLNVWSLADPVSGYLNFYDVRRQLHRWYPIPLAAHLNYWRDPEFYRFVAEGLLFDVKDSSQLAGKPKPDAA